MNKLLLNKLQVAGLVPKLIESDPSQHAPWYISLLMGFCGWLAALFFMSFIGFAISVIYDSFFGLSVVGVSFIIGAYFVMMKNQSEFFTHACIAISCAGQMMIGFALFEHIDTHDSILWLIAMAMQIGLMLLMPSSVHRCMSALFTTLCFAMLLNETSEALNTDLKLISFFSPILMLIVGYLWLNEFTLFNALDKKAGHKKASSIGYGLSFGLIIVKIILSLTAKSNDNDLQNWIQFSPLIDEILCIGILFFFGFKLYKQHNFLNQTTDRLLLVGFTLLICALTLFANGIALSILLILLGYCERNKVLMSLGLLSVFINISVYYYWLEISLLDKSFILFGTGGLALGLLILNKCLLRDGDNNHE